MTDKTKEFSQYVSPDSLRKTTQLLKNFYDLHTKKYCGYEDIDGSQYVGTVENFGSELLLETRKILMNKPPLNNVFIENTFDNYFDIVYSDIINTYDQQNMLCAVLKPNVLLSNKTYQIKFNDIEIVNIPRSQSWSDPNVYKDPYAKTKTPPTLIITNNDDTVEEVSLVLTDKTDINTTYYFRLYNDMSDMFIDTIEDVITNKTLTTVNITNKMNGLPFIWMTVSSLSYLPNILFENNKLYNTQFLSIGTDGHNKQMIYPGLNIHKNDVEHSWVIKATTNEPFKFTDNEKDINNYQCPIKDIYLLKYDIGQIALYVEPLEIIHISFDSSNILITLSNIERNGGWHFWKRTKIDYDYDDTVIDNPVFAYISLDTFVNNLIDTETLISDRALLNTFDIKFNNVYNENDVICQNCVSGIHVDVGSDHSDNSISKKNGVIHSMGDFDGLPKYFSYMTNDNVHRSRLESYVIRDGNKRSLNINKQTAGIIIDAGIPRNDVKKITSDMPITITFDWNDNINRRYISSDESVSKNNSISEITFVDMNTFGNSKIIKYSLKDKFVYHGDRSFSLGIFDIDPELEIGRVYIISNDKSIYENNDNIDNKKAPSTFARICDIPTKYSQLINIQDISPTLIIDKDYVRTETCYTGNNGDKEILYNQTNKDHIMTLSNVIVFPYEYDLSTITHDMIENKFNKYEHLDDVIHLDDNNFVKYEINNGGHDYQVNDTFSFYIGGIRIKGIVKTVDEGIVTKVAYLYTNEDTGETDEFDQPKFSLLYHTIPRTSLNQENIYVVDGISSNGEDLSIKMTINEAWWDSTKMTTNGILDNIVLFKLDYFGNIWSYVYNNDKWIQDEQITGIQLHDNMYDDIISRNDRNIRDVIIDNEINPYSRNVISIDTNVISQFIPTVEKTEDIFTNKDFSKNIEQSYRNIQNGLFYLTTGVDASNYHDLISYEMGHLNYNDYELTIPSYNDLNLKSYTNKTNNFIVIDNENNQPSLFIFNPNIDEINNKTNVHRDLDIINSSRKMLFSDVFGDNNEIIDQKGVISRNIYKYDEFDMTEIITFREQLNSKSIDELITLIENRFKDSLPVRYKDDKYAYSKEMLIDYIIENVFYNNRDSWIYNDDNNVNETIYRKPHVQLFREIGEKVVSNIDEPVGEQPKGDYRSITTESFDPNIIVNNKQMKSSPSFIFRLDNINNIESLQGFRVYDDMDNDISKYSILIINNELYIANIKNDDIDWIKIKRGVN